MAMKLSSKTLQFDETVRRQAVALVGTPTMVRNTPSRRIADRYVAGSSLGVCGLGNGLHVDGNGG
ncbi:hypothetical protein QWJ07_08650 [Frankia sp. RB7]|nr:hypothetical protein [Frankia sp. RB7]